METDGSFSLKNLGRSSISVNGKAVATGQLLTLSSSCLIEVSNLPSPVLHEFLIYTEIY